MSWSCPPLWIIAIKLFTIASRLRHTLLRTLSCYGLPFAWQSNKAFLVCPKLSLRINLAPMYRGRISATLWAWNEITTLKWSTQCLVNSSASFVVSYCFIRKDFDAGKDWGQEEKGMAEDEMVGWHHQLDEHEFEQTPGDGERQGSLAWYSPWGRKELDMTELLDNNC